MPTQDKHNNTQYRQWFEHSADAHLIIEDRRFIDCNAATVRMLGYDDKAELLQTHPSELSPPKQPDGRDSLEKAEEMMAIARERGTHRFEWDHVRANGEVFPVEVLLTAITSPEGQPQIHTVWRDITARKQRETNLRSSEEKFRLVVTNSNAIIFILDPQGVFTLSEGRGLSVLNLEPGEMVGRSALELYADFPEIVAALQRSLRGEEVQDFFSADDISFDIHFNPIRDESGQLIHVIGVATNVSERRRLLQLQETLRELAAELLSPLDPQSIAKVSARHIRKFFKSEALGIWYHDSGRQISQSLFLEDTPLGADQPQEFQQEQYPFTPEDPLEVNRAPRAYMKLRTAEELEQNNAAEPFGSVERMSACILFVPMVWEERKIGVISVHSYTCNAFNETDLGHLQLFADQVGVALQRALSDEELVRSLEEKEVLLREIQHRTKNNMHVILSLMNMQARENPHPELSEAFDRTRDRIFAMSLVYDQLQKSGSFTSIELKPYLTALANNLYRSLVHRPERIRLNIRCEDIPIGLEQAVPLGIIFNETVSNAMKHAFPEDDGGTIQISVKRKDHNLVRVLIQDDGIGLSPVKLKKTGTSLGLRLVSMLADDQLQGKHEMVTGKGLCHKLEFRLIDSPRSG